MVVHGTGRDSPDGTAVRIASVCLEWMVRRIVLVELTQDAGAADGVIARNWAFGGDCRSLQANQATS